MFAKKANFDIHKDFALKSGATDYVLKQRLSRLVPVVKRALRKADKRAERRKAGTALKASEEKFRALVENLEIGISLISPNMEILFLNKRMRKWFPDIDTSKKPICYEAFNKPPG